MAPPRRASMACDLDGLCLTHFGRHFQRVDRRWKRALDETGKPELQLRGTCDEHTLRAVYTEEAGAKARSNPCLAKVARAAAAPPRDTGSCDCQCGGTALQLQQVLQRRRRRRLLLRGWKCRHNLRRRHRHHRHFGLGLAHEHRKRAPRCLGALQAAVGAGDVRGLLQ